MPLTMFDPSTSNAAFLSQQSAAIAAKKKAKQARHGQVQEVVFDDRARKQFLTGFHRRKLEREATYKRRAKERERQEKIADRAERKKEMLERAKRNRIDIERALGNDEIDDDYDPISDVIHANQKGKEKLPDQEVEFETEDVTATVTVVEEFDVDELITGKSQPKPDLQELDEDEKGSGLSRHSSPSEEPPERRPQPSVLELAAPPVRRNKQANYETQEEKQARVLSEKKKRLKASLEARERAKAKSKKRKDDHGRKRPHR
ncbi:hypothetical protein FRB90_001933 [Tulasnella sp. 427]|nr:hypothetical protein FRB90_001933 [Tulasnella sp. 427]